MKELEKGNINEIKQICTGAGHDFGGCGAKFLLTKDDITLLPSNNYEETISYTFTCPNCGCITNIRKEIIPLNMRKEILIMAKEKAKKNREQRIIKTKQKIANIFKRNNK